MPSFQFKDILIRQTGGHDIRDIMAVETAAFGHDKEARLSAALIDDPTAAPLLSLLAVYNNVPVGHILFTRVRITGNDSLVHILAPLAVKPAFQKQGIGGLLIKKGLRMLTDMGSAAVFVLGHMEYYPRYGFVPDAGKAGFTAPYPIPEEFANAWMVQSLSPDGNLPPGGRVTVADQLDRPEHWRE